MSRPLMEIAREIRRDWNPVGMYADPYVTAMESLGHITEKYGSDSAKSIVAYFLSNASAWRGEVARRIKAELKEMCKMTSLKKIDLDCPHCQGRGCVFCHSRYRGPAAQAPADKLSLGQARALVKLHRISIFMLKSALMNVATMRGKNKDKPCWCGVIVHGAKHDEFCRLANRAIKSTQNLT